MKRSIRVQGGHRLQGHVALPPSKSQSIRALLFASVANGDSELKGVLRSPDVQAVALACRALGATLVSRPCGQDREDWSVRGKGRPKRCTEPMLDLANSGLGLRLLSAWVAMLEQPVVLDGDDSLRRRPMWALARALVTMGAEVTWLGQPGFAPLRWKGPWHPQPVVVEGSDSQPVSALLLGLSLWPGVHPVEVRSPGEWPWVAMTLAWLRRMGVGVHAETSVDRAEITLDVVGPWGGFVYAVPGDMSSLAFPIVASLLTGSELILSGLDVSGEQGDAALLEVLRDGGARWEMDDRGRLQVAGWSAQPQPVIDVSGMVDALPILAVWATQLPGQTCLVGAKGVRDKESDRLAMMASELSKMGADVVDVEDGLVISGPTALRGARVNSAGDHRVAMALAVAGLAADGETWIHDTACVDKTFPGFVSCFQGVGAKMEEVG